MNIDQPAMDDAAGNQEITPNTIWKEVARIGTSPQLRRSGNLRRFLTYCVERSISGNTRDLREATVGQAVFDREDGYDPRIDPVVRVEARRLRKKLAEYYSSEGKGDALRIELPKGSYAPRISWAPPLQPTAAEFKKMALAVLPFHSCCERADILCRDITEEIIIAMGRSPHVRVASRMSVFRFQEPSGDIRSIGETLGVDRVLDGSARLWDSSLRIRAQVIDVRDGLHLWGDAFDFPRTETDEHLAREVAEQVCSKIGLVLGDDALIGSDSPGSGF
jgi:TolB-like protein